MNRFPYLVISIALIAAHSLCAAPASTSGTTNTPPFRYIRGKAFHILPHTTSDESGYFSLCEGANGRLYVGAAQYDFNAYLVEVDPRTGKQRIVIDTRRLTGAWASGYAAQSKIHTRNFVGPSGKIYVGSKQGYRRIPGDASEYPGGYVMTYDPKTEKAECLGIPYPKEGVIDVVADEKRGLLYIVTCEEQHFMRYDTKTRQYRELGPRLACYASTLIDGRGRANAITKDFQLYQYDPGTEQSTTRDIRIEGRKWTPTNSLPATWNLAGDGRTAYLINMTDPALYAIDLGGEGDFIEARNVGLRTAGKEPDSRCSLVIAPDGRVYTLVRIANDTGFGGGYLHQLTRYTPKTGKHEILGVVAVKNPDFFDFGPLWNGQSKPWSNGFPKLPDGVMTPYHAHMGLIMAHDGTLYATFLSPYTLLRLDPVK
jgi:hypothetical protein